jgi:hypothetical protein
MSILLPAGLELILSLEGVRATIALRTEPAECW